MTGLTKSCDTSVPKCQATNPRISCTLVSRVSIAKKLERLHHNECIFVLKHMCRHWLCCRVVDNPSEKNCGAEKNCREWCGDVDQERYRFALWDGVVRQADLTPL
ncbi:hypothetical protein BLA17378_04655 [Burkholderia aenigmatica]|uniref:Uncharacterized protein n=1 Tax=Burkholderia aenigmatica TaxID=2015348 RepID=A0ABY6XW08_9BURK|nr:hypothetical protein BLA17378_04655 [Burkholderia aenigmatica]